jgi:hypothetical protein
MFFLLHSVKFVGEIQKELNFGWKNMKSTEEFWWVFVVWKYEF